MNDPVSTAQSSDSPAGNASGKSMDELRALVGSAGDPLTIQGEEIVISPMVVRMVPQAVALVSPIWAAFQGKTSDQLDITKLLLDNYEPVVSLTSILSGKTREYVDNLSLDDMVSLTTKVIQVNADFFIRRLFPALYGAMALLLETSENLKKKVGSGKESSSS